MSSPLLSFVPTRLGRLGASSAICGFLAAVLGSGPVLADGPGLPNVAYPAAQLHKTLSAFDSRISAPRGHGFVTMHRGYLVVISAKDGGGGEGTGNISLYDISNPAAPVCVFTTVNNPNYSAASGHSPANLREVHSIAFSGDYMAVTSSGNGENGMQIWELRNVDKPADRTANGWFGPRRVRMIHFPNVYGGDYSEAPWSLTWAGRYIYCGVPGKGLFIVDATNPETAALANRGSGKPNPLPMSEVGGKDNGAHQWVSLGGTLIQGRKNFTAFDISDPLNPRRTYDNSADAGYSIQRYGDRAFGFGTSQLTTWNVANINSPSMLATTSTNFNGGYGIVQDGILHYGGGSLVATVDITGNPPWTVNRITPTKPAGREKDHALFGGADWDFFTPLGNLAFLSNDHGSGSALIVNQLAPDTTPPSVVVSNPKNNAINVPVTTPIGVQFSDQIDTRTVTPENIFLRRSGTTTPIAGRWSNHLGIINFMASENLAGNTTYELVINTGLRDLVGNPVSAQNIIRFSTGASVDGGIPELVADLAPVTPKLRGSPVNFSVTTSGGAGTVDVLWDFGDGTTLDSDTALTASKTYAAAGNYNVTVTVTRGSQSITDSQVLTVHNPITTTAPAYSSTIVYDDAAVDKVWVVNTDANTVTAINATTGVKLHETPTGEHPRTLAKAPDGRIWVANEKSDSITVHNANDGSLFATISLPRGSGPFGILFSPNGANAYVSLGTSWEVARIDPVTRTVSTPVLVGPHPRGLAMTGDSSRLFVTRFISAADKGEVYELNPTTLTQVRVFDLIFDTSPDTEDNGRGVPNYLVSAIPSPDGTAIALPSTKANTARGLRRDGVALDFDNTVRTITSFLDLAGNTEFLSRRTDLNDRDSAIAGAYTPLGNYLLVVTQGSNTIDVLDAYTGVVEVSYPNTGLAPRGIVLNPSGTRAYVQNFMSRDVKILNIAEITQNNVFTVTDVVTTPVVANETLSAAVLRGKQIFYNAADPRMSQDKYLSCASCHTDAGQDGRIWDFSNRAEGFRNTIELNGRSGMGHGLVHWSANFDEIQDFENDIREHQGGRGFLTDADFEQTRDTLGPLKTGRNSDLDALAAYVATLDSVGRSPFRNEDGTLSPLAVAGKAVFEAVNCTTCHKPHLDYRDGLSHNVGTLTANSGQRLGAALTGIDTPTLIGLWDTAPYFHDGSAATLADTLTPAHAGVALSESQKSALVAYLLELEDGIEVQPAAPATPTVSVGAGTGTLVVTWSDTSDNEIRFHVQRRAVGTTPWITAAAALPANSTSFIDTGLPHNTAFEYQVRSETSTLFSAWVFAGSATTAEPPAVIILDNVDAGVTFTGNTWTTTSGTGFIGENFNTGDSGTAVYAPALSAGEYRIEVKFTSGWTQLRNSVPHSVNHVNGVFNTNVDQTAGDVWVQLGTTFTLDPSSTVVIGRPASGRPSWDAVRFTRLASATPPVITAEPLSLSVATGGSATFSVSVTGTAPFTYQWRKGGDNLPGEHGPSLTINPVDASHAGNYSVVITNSAGNTTSASASLTVLPPPDTTPSVSTTSLAAATVGSLFSATLEATSGNPPLTWSATGLPKWLVLNPATGALSGTPPISGSFSFTAIVTDSDGDTAQRSLTHAVNAATGGDGSWIETTGTLVMEAEAANVTANGDSVQWASTTEGDVTYRAVGYNAAAIATFATGTELSFPVTITTPGTYTLAVRRRAPDGFTDSVFLGLNGVQVGLNQYTGVAAAFTWTPAVSLGELTAGSHTISLRRREAGWQVDRVFLTRISGTSPTGTVVGPAAQARSIAVAEPTGIERWRHLHFTPSEITNTAISGPMANPMTDGVVNKLKYALGQDPWVRTNSVLAPAPTLPDGRSAFRFTRRVGNTDIPLTVQTATTLTGTWSDSPSGYELVVLSTTAGVEQVEVRAPVGWTGTPWFVRLSVP